VVDGGPWYVRTVGGEATVVVRAAMAAARSREGVCGSWRRRTGASICSLVGNRYEGREDASGGARRRVTVGSEPDKLLG